MLMTLILFIINFYLHGTCQKYIPLNDASFHFLSAVNLIQVGVITPWAFLPQFTLQYGTRPCTSICFLSGIHHTSPLFQIMQRVISIFYYDVWK